MFEVETELQVAGEVLYLSGRAVPAGEELEIEDIEVLSQDGELELTAQLQELAQRALLDAAWGLAAAHHGA